MGSGHYCQLGFNLGQISKHSLWRGNHTPSTEQVQRTNLHLFRQVLSILMNFSLLLQAAYTHPLSEMLGTRSVSDSWNFFGFWNVCIYTVIHQSGRDRSLNLLRFHMHFRHRAYRWCRTVFWLRGQLWNFILVGLCQHLDYAAVLIMDFGIWMFNLYSLSLCFATKVVERKIRDAHSNLV